MFIEENTPGLFFFPIAIDAISCTIAVSPLNVATSKAPQPFVALKLTSAPYSIKSLATACCLAPKKKIKILILVKEPLLQHQKVDTLLYSKLV